MEKMKRISKSINEPPEIADFRIRFLNQPTPVSWNQFKRDSTRTRPVKFALRNDQRKLCAYCEIKLYADNETVEHIVPRSADQNRELDWQNLLLVCAGDERTP